MILPDRSFTKIPETMRTISSECLSFAPLALLGISQNTCFQGEHATETIHGISCKLKGFGGSTVCCYRLLLPFAAKFAGDTVVAPVAGCVISVVPAIVLIVQVAQFTAGALTGCINTAASPTPNVTPFLSPLSLINRMRFLSAFLWSARGRCTVNFYCFLKMAFSTDSSGQPFETIHSFPLFGH